MLTTCKIWSVLFVQVQEVCLPFSSIMFENGPTYFKNLALWTREDFLRHVWPFFNIMYERVCFFLMKNSKYVAIHCGKLLNGHSSVNVCLFFTISGQWLISTLRPQLSNAFARNQELWNTFIRVRISIRWNLHLYNFSQRKRKVL